MSQPLHDSAATQQDGCAALVGQVLEGKWHLEDLLGIGGMAAVYAARHTGNMRSVAIKVLHPELIRNGVVRDRFYREAYAANRVGHEGTVPVLDDGVTADGAPYLIMDLLRGETLEERWRRSGHVMQPDQAMDIIESLLDVLASAHRNGVIHRDIKPENVFITENEQVKLLDFGIASLEEDDSGVTKVGQAMGTPGFMPPEQARGRWNEVDHRSDLWALGATAFVLLSGRQVHEAETINEILLKTMTERPRTLGSMSSKLPPGIVEVIDRALEVEPELRFQSAEEMLNALNEARHGARQPSSFAPTALPQSAQATQGFGTRSTSLPVAISTPQPETSKSWRKPLATVGAAALGALATFVFVAGQSGADPTDTPASAAQPVVAPAEKVQPKAAPSPKRDASKGASSANHAEVQDEADANSNREEAAASRSEDSARTSDQASLAASGESRSSDAAASAPSQRELAQAARRPQAKQPSTDDEQSPASGTDDSVNSAEASTPSPPPAPPPEAPAPRSAPDSESAGFDPLRRRK